MRARKGHERAGAQGARACAVMLVSHSSSLFFLSTFPCLTFERSVTPINLSLSLSFASPFPDAFVADRFSTESTCGRRDGTGARRSTPLTFFRGTHIKASILHRHRQQDDETEASLSVLVTVSLICFAFLLVVTDKQQKSLPTVKAMAGRIVVRGILFSVGLDRLRLSLQ